RYSVLSYFGLVPAALSGVNVEELLHSAKDGELSCQDDSPESNLGLWLGAAIGELARRGRDKLTFFVSGPIESFGLWAEQLVAGWALEINPFDQLDVQEAKDKSKEVLAGGSIPEIEVASDEALRALLADASPPHYVAVLGYLAYSEELDAAIAELRTTIRAAT